jgi:hypothetical protein
MLISGGIGGAGELTRPTVNTDAVEEVKMLFAERAAEEARYRNEYQFIDPSR